MSIPGVPILLTTDGAGDFQRENKRPIYSANKNIMQSYLKHEEYSDRKVKMTPLKQNEYCFIQQLIADHQRSKVPLREFRWIGP